MRIKIEGVENHSECNLLSTSLNEPFSQLLLEITSSFCDLQQGQFLLFKVLHKFSLFLLQLLADEPLQLLFLTP